MARLNSEVGFSKGTPLSTLDKPRHNSAVPILVVFVLFLLLANFPRIIRGEVEPITFEYLLEVLSNAPELNVSWVADLTSPITADWGGVNFLRDYINLFADVSSSILYLATLILHVVIFLLYFVRTFFGF